MSLSTATQRRLPTIKAKLIEGYTIGQIADICKVHEKTIDRDLKSFLDSGEFEVWLKEEWTRLHAKIVKENPAEAYRQVSKLISRNITRKAEIKTESTITERKEATFKLDSADRELLNTVARKYIKANNTTESASIH